MSDFYVFLNCLIICLFSGCINGVCAKPNQCTCRNGWVIDKTGTRCDPKCERPCFNGKIDSNIHFYLPRNRRFVSFNDMKAKKKL